MAPTDSKEWRGARSGDAARAASIPSGAGQLGLAAVSGLGLGAAFPTTGWSWLAWIALVPLFAAIVRARSAWLALGCGYVAGVLFFAVSCPWIFTTIHLYGGLSGALAGFVFVLFLLLMGGYLALFAVAAHWLGRASGHRVWPLPFVWIAVELARTYTPMGGFPWNLLGYSQFQHAGFMLAAPIAGVYGCGFLIAAGNALITALLGRPGRIQAALEAVALTALVGFATLPYHSPVNPPRTLRAVLVQPNTGLNLDWTQAGLNKFLAAQTELSVPSQPHSAQLVIWPEQPAPLDFNSEPALQQSAAQLLDRTHAAFLFGEEAFVAGHPRNSALLLHADGTLGPRYDKMHLVPFGEYVPLPDWLKQRAGVGKMVQEVGDFVPGDHPVLFSLGGHPFATLICYESIFPALARADVRMGAEFLVNQSDDSWYGDSSAAAQGLMMARVRAMENRRWLLRDTDNGITAAIDPYGRVTASLPRFQALALTTGFSPASGLTFYTRHGDWFAYLCCLVVAVFCGLALDPRHAVAPRVGRG